MSVDYARYVSNIINTKHESIDWSKALELIDFMNKHRSKDGLIFDTIKEIAFRGDRRIKINCITLIDSFFKNGNPALLQAIQQSQSALAIGSAPVVNDPFVHRELCKFSDQWANICRKANVLSPNFVDWQRRLFSFRYRYIMTPETAQKFSQDFSSAVELLTMFNQCIVNALIDNLGPDDEMLQEILPNVNEVHQRVLELKPTMPDPYVLRIIDYIDEYCQICKQAYRDYAQAGTFDIDSLANIAGRGIPQPGDVPQQHIPAPIPTPAPAPMPVPQRPAPAPVVDDLLDLGNPTPPPANQPVYQPAYPAQPMYNPPPQNNIIPPQQSYNPQQQPIYPQQPPV